jgi:hypothetical protein
MEAIVPTAHYECSAPRALAHAIALALCCDHGGVVRESIEERGGELLIAGKRGDPLTILRFVVTTVARRS